MKVIQKKQKDGVVTLEATATVEEVEKALNACLINFAQTLGLRPTPDKTVQQAITEKMGVQDPDSLVMQQAIEYLAPFALDKMDITPAFPPKPIQKSKLVRKHPFLFELEVTLKIPYELTSYEPVELKLKPMQVDAAEVDRQIQDLADRYPSYVATDPHPVRNGDSVLLQLECKENGKVLEALTTDARTYTTGQGLMPEGFDEHIIGMEVGETKEFTFEGPDVDDQGNETTTTVECKATVVEIQKAVTPTIDDEWIATNMPMYKDLATFKNMINLSDILKWS